MYQSFALKSMLSLLFSPSEISRFHTYAFCPFYHMIPTNRISPAYSLNAYSRLLIWLTAPSAAKSRFSSTAIAGIQINAHLAYLPNGCPFAASSCTAAERFRILLQKTDAANSYLPQSENTFRGATFFMTLIISGEGLKRSFSPPS